MRGGDEEKRGMMNEGEEVIEVKGIEMRGK